MELVTGQKIKIVIEKIAQGGDGLARKNGFVIFVPYTSPQDSIEAELIEKRKKTLETVESDEIEQIIFNENEDSIARRIKIRHTKSDEDHCRLNKKCQKMEHVIQK